MNLKSSRCKIIHGTSQGLYDNLSDPFRIFRDGLDSLSSLCESALDGEKRVCFVGSSCMYPDKDSALVEEDLGTGSVYPANGLFSYTKLLGWQLCKIVASKYGYQYFVAIPGDIFGSPTDSHFICQIMKKMHEAKVAKLPKITLFGTGAAIRHPIYDKDFIDLLEKVFVYYEGVAPLNISSPIKYAKKVSSIAYDIKEVVGYKGEIEWDAHYSDGQKVKILSNEKLLKTVDHDFTPWLVSLDAAYGRMLNEN